MVITTQLWTPHSTTGLLCDLSKSLPLFGLCLFLLGSDFPLLPVNPRPAVKSQDKALLPGDSYPASAMFPWTSNCHRVNPIGYTVLGAL